MRTADKSAVCGKTHKQAARAESQIFLRFFEGGELGPLSTTPLARPRKIEPVALYSTWAEGTASRGAGHKAFSFRPLQWPALQRDKSWAIFAGAIYAGPLLTQQSMRCHILPSTPMPACPPLNAHLPARTCHCSAAISPPHPRPLTRHLGSAPCRLFFSNSPERSARAKDQVSCDSADDEVGPVSTPHRSRPGPWRYIQPRGGDIYPPRAGGGYLSASCGGEVPLGPCKAPLLVEAIFG